MMAVTSRLLPAVVRQSQCPACQRAILFDKHRTIRLLSSSASSSSAAARAANKSKSRRGHESGAISRAADVAGKRRDDNIDSPPSRTAPSSSSSCSFPTTTAAQTIRITPQFAADAASGGVTSRTVYYCDDKKLPDARMLYAVGFMLFFMCINAADVVRREPKSSRQQKPDQDGNSMDVQAWPAWKRYTASAALAAAGITIGGIAIYWPTRILKKLVLLPPQGKLLPSTRELSKAGQYTTPYHECSIMFISRATELLPRWFGPRTKIVPFNNLRLLGPLSSSPQWYHPRSGAFDENRKKRGNYPSNTPLGVVGERTSYSLRKAGADFTDLEGFERALLENDRLPPSSSKG